MISKYSKKIILNNNQTLRKTQPRGATQNWTPRFWYLSILKLEVEDFEIFKNAASETWHCILNLYIFLYLSRALQRVENGSHEHPKNDIFWKIRCTTAARALDVPIY